MLINIIFDLDLQSTPQEIQEGGNYFETFMRGSHFFALVLSICRFDPTFLTWTILLCISMVIQCMFLLLFATGALDHGELTPYDLTQYGVIVLCCIWILRFVASFKAGCYGRFMTKGKRREADTSYSTYVVEIRSRKLYCSHITGI